MFKIFFWNLYENYKTTKTRKFVKFKLWHAVFITFSHCFNYYMKEHLTVKCTRDTSPTTPSPHIYSTSTFHETNYINVKSMDGFNCVSENKVYNLNNLQIRFGGYCYFKFKHLIYRQTMKLNPSYTFRLVLGIL